MILYEPDKEDPVDTQSQQWGVRWRQSIHSKKMRIRKAPPICDLWSFDVAFGTPHVNFYHLINWRV